MKYENKTELFETVPIYKAALTLIVPTVISQLVILVYNTADTWYIGKTGDASQVAAVTVTYPIFMLLNAISNLFAIGGASLISRLLGLKKRNEAGKVASFTLWASVFSTLLLSMICYVFADKVLSLLKVQAESFDYAKKYIFWTVVIGGVPTVLNIVLAGIVRAEGETKISSLAMSIGGILNIIMDPVFIFAFRMGVAGAALSTCISNTVSMLYLCVYIIKNRNNSLVKIWLLPKKISLLNQKEIYSVGTPAALQIILAAVSNAFLLRLMSSYATEAISGIGVMQKIESIPFQMIMGISDGVLPLVAYNYASGNKKRMKNAVDFALISGVICAIISFALCEIFASQMVYFFISDAKSVYYGATFTRLRVLALPFITVEFMLIAVFQGVGGAKQALILSFFRKGILDLPIMLFANYIMPMYGLMLVQPFMEFIGCIIALVLYKNFQNSNQYSLVSKNNI